MVTLFIDDQLFTPHVIELYSIDDEIVTGDLLALAPF